MCRTPSCRRLSSGQIPGAFRAAKPDTRFAGARQTLLRPVLHPVEMETHMAEVAAAVIEKRKGISTATISTCLYKRGSRNQYVQDVLPVAEPKSTSMVGPAFTLRYIAAREDRNGRVACCNPAQLQRT